MSRSRCSFAARALFVLALFIASREARAQAVDDASRAAARQLGYSGVEAFEAKNYALAEEKLDKAYRVLKAPSLGLWSARAMEKRGKLVEAAERYLEIARLPAPVGADVTIQKKAQADAARERELLLPRVPSVVIQLENASPSEAQITLDGVRIAPELIGEAVPVNPGEHALEGSFGEQRVSLKLQAAEAERKTAVVPFEARRAPAPAAPAAALPTPSVPRSAPPPPPPLSSTPETATQASSGSALRTLGFTAVGIGAAGLVASGVTALIALSNKGDLDDSESCRSNQCLPEERDNVDGYSSLRTISTLSFYAGSALGAAGVVLLLTAPSDTERSVGLVVSPASVGLRGRF